MSLFIAGVAFDDPADYAAAKIAIFLASLVAGGLGALILWPGDQPAEDTFPTQHTSASIGG
jgi:NhaA family Na+:H+ antiporter